MKKYCKALVNLGVAFIILLLIVFLVPKLLVFFAPFVAGWIIALIASPLVRFFEEKVKIKRKAGSAFVIVAVIALVILILYLVGAKLTDEIMGLIGALPDIWDSAENDFADIGQNLSVIYNRFPVDVQQSIMDVINQIGSYVGDLLGKIGTCHRKIVRSIIPVFNSCFQFRQAAFFPFGQHLYECQFIFEMIEDNYVFV